MQRQKRCAVSAVLIAVTAGANRDWELSNKICCVTARTALQLRLSSAGGPLPAEAASGHGDH